MGTSHIEHAKEGASQFFIACGNTARLLRTTQKSLHHVMPFVRIDGRTLTAQNDQP